tara:strand:+ start:295 stop:1053 length:759 start_codon:yes stop_codon:yes gene_type:complete
MANRRIKWVIAGSVSLSVAVVGVGMYYAVYDVLASTYEWPEAGAAYADLPTGGTLGQELPKNEDGSEDQTLAVVLAANTRLENLTVDLQMGKASADCISIERASGTTGYLYVDTFTMDGLVSPTLVMSNSEVHQMILSGSVDGHHTGPTQDSTIPSIEIGSLYGASSYTAEGRVDRLLITLNGDAIIKDISITGKCSTGPVDLDYIKAGQLSLINVRIGDDGVITTPAVDIDSSTKIYSLSDSFTDQPIIVK